MNTALAPGTEEILLGTFLMSRIVLDSKTISEKAGHDSTVAFLLLAMGSRVELITHVDATLGLPTVSLLA